MTQKTFTQTAEYVKLAEVSYVNFKGVDLTKENEIKNRMMYKKQKTKIMKK